MCLFDVSRNIKVHVGVGVKRPLGSQGPMGHADIRVMPALGSSVP